MVSDGIHVYATDNCDASYGFIVGYGVPWMESGLNLI